MPTYSINKIVSAPDERFKNLGARLDVVVRAPDDPTTLKFESSSSSVGIPFPESSSSLSSGPDYNIFLFRGTSETSFLGVCSPLDMDTWPIDVPQVGTGLYRASSVSLTFRHEFILDDLWAHLINDITALAGALTDIASMKSAESFTYDFSLPAASIDSSSSMHGIRNLKIHRDRVLPYPTTSPTGYRLNVTCTADGTDNKIFLHRDDEPDRTGATNSRPIAVCSPGDLAEYPSDTPDATVFPHHYRKSTFDITSKDVGLLREVWENIKFETERLAAALQYHLDTNTSVIQTVSFDE